MTSSTIDVLVVGAGPVGTTLAIDLARRGVRCRIVDRGAHAFEGSRAKGIQARTLEVFDDLGVLSEVLAAGSRYPKLGVHLGPFTVPWQMMDDSEPSDGVQYPNCLLVAQFQTDRLLHARLEGLGQRVEFSTGLTRVEQDNGTVTATLSSGGAVERVTARYLVGADGGSSLVRKEIGVAFSGLTREEDRMLIVDATVEGLSRNRWHVWPGARGRFVGACPLPHSDLFQWMIRLAPGEAVPEGEAAINQRIQAHIRTPGVRLRGIRWKSLWRPNIRLADSYRRGRVFLAGDAAHVHPPAGAQGLNTGVQDAYNLGWKLGQVLAGADAVLLDSYEAERLPTAAGVLGLATRKYDAIAKLRPSSITRGSDESQLTVSYRGGPLAPDVAARTKNLHVGDRAPNAFLADRQGTQVRLLDLFRGPHFTLIAYGSSAAKALDELAWPSAGAGLKRVVVDAPSARADHALADSRGSFRKCYGLKHDALILVRPDGYLGQIASENMATSTRAAIGAMTPNASTAVGPGAGPAQGKVAAP